MEERYPPTQKMGWSLRRPRPHLRASEHRRYKFGPCVLVSTKGFYSLEELVSLTSCETKRRKERCQSGPNHPLLTPQQLPSVLLFNRMGDLSPCLQENGQRQQQSVDRLRHLVAGPGDAIRGGWAGVCFTEESSEFHQSRPRVVEGLRSSCPALPSL